MAQEYQPYQDFPNYAAPEPPKRNTNRTLLIAVIVVLVLCCCCVVFALLLYFVLGDFITDELGITYLLSPVLMLI
jgi:hypothetical protein